jgi:hypothetical protein
MIKISCKVKFIFVALPHSISAFLFSIRGLNSIDFRAFAISSLPHHTHKLSLIWIIYYAFQIINNSVLTAFHVLILLNFHYTPQDYFLKWSPTLSLRKVFDLTTTNYIELQISRHDILLYFWTPVLALFEVCLCYWQTLWSTAHWSVLVSLIFLIQYPDSVVCFKDTCLSNYRSVHFFLFFPFSLNYLFSLSHMHSQLTLCSVYSQNLLSDHQSL